MDTSDNSIFKMITPMADPVTPASLATPLMDIIEDNDHSIIEKQKNPVTRPLMYKMSTEVSPSRGESVDLLDLLGQSENVASEGSNLPSSDEVISQPVAPKVVKPVKPTLKVASRVPLRNAPKPGVRPKVVKVVNDKPVAKSVTEAPKTPLKNTTKDSTVSHHVTMNSEPHPAEPKPVLVKQTVMVKEPVSETISMETLQSMVGVKR
jgi:hypothetical protein